MVETYVVTLVNVQVRVHVPLMSTPDGAAHTGPSLLEGEDALDIVAVELLSGDGVDDRGLNAEEGKRGTPRFRRRHTSKGRDDVGSGLRLPVGLWSPLVYVERIER